MRQIQYYYFIFADKKYDRTWFFGTLEYLKRQEKEKNILNLEIDNIGFLITIKNMEEKEKRYCKGCYKDVTDDMFCSCAERPLLKSATLSAKELYQKENPEIPEREISIKKISK